MAVYVGAGVSGSILTQPFDVVHVNAEFVDQASDHDPQVTRVVLLDFTGFYSPIDSPPVLNSMKAGAAVPVKFSLGGDMVLAIIAAGYPRSQPIVCDATEPVDGIEETVTSGSSGLQYDATTGQYTYVWKTDKSWEGTCRVFTLRLVDGTIHEAYFKFMK